MSTIGGGGGEEGSRGEIKKEEGGECEEGREDV